MIENGGDLIGFNNPKSIIGKDRAVKLQYSAHLPNSVISTLINFTIDYMKYSITSTQLIIKENG